ncbi:MAG TPA: hypothetical protein VFT74_11315 [Isosphaeraceae bacterium]|nr:hypothetical protein [Isosphaeraceae bacterium]
MWTCEKCGSKIDPSFDVCWKCGTSREGVEDPTFVTADEASPIQDSRYDPIAVPDESIKSRWSEVVGDHQHDLVSCYQALSVQEAMFLANQLSDNGIPSMSDTIDMQDALGTWEGNPRVYCRAGDYPRARVWLAEYERKKQTDHPPQG